MKETILVIDDESSLLQTMKLILSRSGFEVLTASTGIEGVKMLESELENILLVVTDLALPGGVDGIDVLDRARAMEFPVPVIVITAYGSVEVAVKAMQKGAFNFLTKPINFKVLIEQIKKGIENSSLSRENRRLKQEINAINDKRYRIVHCSDSIERLLSEAAGIAATDETVLITGESGTGKELLARYILRASERHNKSFVAFNAAAIQETLIESEMFGHVKGAFTGAERNSPGYIGSAEGGTLFIDEIGEMPLNLQSKLLRFIQEKEYMPVGSSRAKRADVRIVAATNKDLELEVKEGRFREDLYYRLKRFTIWIPPLRDRPEDISCLVDFYLKRYADEYKKPVPFMDPSLLRDLEKRRWQGNVRDLENFIAAYVLSSGRKVEPQPRETVAADDENLVKFNVGEITMDEIERMVIQAALRVTDGNKSKAARLLGISQRTIYRKITGEES